MVSQQMGSPEEGFQRRRPAPGLGNKSHRGSRGGGYGYRSKKPGQSHASFHSSNGPPFPPDQPPSCFNCGSYDHMVHHCPEYQHEASPGFHKHQRPPKRQRTSDGPRHQYRDDFPPAHRGHPHRSYSHPSPYPPSYHHSGYDHPGPPSPDREEWHHRSPYGYPPYDPRGPPPPMNGYDGYDGYDAHSPAPPYPYSAGPPPGYHSRRPSRRREGDYPDYPMEGPPQPSSWDGPRSHSWRGKGRRGRDGHPSSRRPDHWVEGFYDLDTPENRAANGQVVWRPPHPVGRPLPAMFDDLDDICKLPPPTSLPPGMSVSKYFLNKGPEEFNENIRNTEDWPFMMGDPIFADIPSDGELVPIDDLVTRQKEMIAAHKVVPRKPVVEEDEEEEEERGEEAEYNSDQAYVTHMQQGDDEDEGEEIRGEENDQVRSYPVSEQGRSFDEAYNDDYREESPVKTPSQSYPVSSHQYGSPTFEDREGSGRDEYSRPPSRESYRDHDGVSQGGSRGPSPDNEREISHSPVNHHDQDESATRTESHEPHTLSSQKSNGRFQHQSQRNNKQKWARPSGYKRQFSQTWNSEENYSTPKSTTPGINDSDEQFQATPEKYSQAHSPSETYHRKRSREESLELPDDEPQRQVDDVAPRLKRRHPRVAEAYSRRW